MTPKSQVCLTIRYELFDTVTTRMIHTLEGRHWRELVNSEVTATAALPFYSGVYSTILAIELYFL